MKISIEIEYLTDNMVNFHIRENDVFDGAAAVFFFRNIAEALFKSGVEAVLARIKKGKAARHIRLFVSNCGMRRVMEDESTVTYYLKRSEF